MIKELRLVKVLLVFPLIFFLLALFSQFYLPLPSSGRQIIGNLLLALSVVSILSAFIWSFTRDFFYGRSLRPRDMKDGKYDIEHLGATRFFRLWKINEAKPKEIRVIYDAFSPRYFPEDAPSDCMISVAMETEWIKQSTWEEAGDKKTITQIVPL